jgi:hypothetical protein
MEDIWASVQVAMGILTASRIYTTLGSWSRGKQGTRAIYPNSAMLSTFRQRVKRRGQAADLPFPVPFMVPK